MRKSITFMYHTHTYPHDLFPLNFSLRFGFSFRLIYYVRIFQTKTGYFSWFFEPFAVLRLFYADYIYIDLVVIFFHSIPFGAWPPHWCMQYSVELKLNPFIEASCLLWRGCQYNLFFRYLNFLWAYAMDSQQCFGIALWVIMKINCFENQMANSINNIPTFVSPKKKKWKSIKYGIGFACKGDFLI